MTTSKRLFLKYTEHLDGMPGHHTFVDRHGVYYNYNGLLGTDYGQGIDEGDFITLDTEVGKYLWPPDQVAGWFELTAVKVVKVKFNGDN